MEEPGVDRDIDLHGYRRVREHLRHWVPPTVKSAVKVARAELAWRMGSDRYSWPGHDQLDRRISQSLPDTGVFLEIGANDGWTMSNTYHLEKYQGWRGILIEPLPRAFWFCRLHRRRSKCYNLACVGPEGPARLEMVCSDLSTLAPDLVADPDRRVRRPRRVTVPTSTLSRIIDQADLGAPDFISIDVEGAEDHVLAGLERRHTPNLLVVETARPEAVDKRLPGMRRVEQFSPEDWLYARA